LFLVSLRLEFIPNTKYKIQVSWRLLRRPSTSSGLLAMTKEGCHPGASNAFHYLSFWNEASVSERSDRIWQLCCHPGA